MSMVAKCIDNGPMEALWGMIKRERYYGKRFTSRESVVEIIVSYIEYYNNKRLQRNLGMLTPMDKHELYLKAAYKLPAGNTYWQKDLYIFNCLLDGNQFIVK
jgi:transposase InsO family protein